MVEVKTKNKVDIDVRAVLDKHAVGLDDTQKYLYAVIAKSASDRLNDPEKLHSTFHIEKIRTDGTHKGTHADNVTDTVKDNLNEMLATNDVELMKNGFGAVKGEIANLSSKALSTEEGAGSIAQQLARSNDVDKAAEAADKAFDELAEKIAVKNPEFKDVAKKGFSYV